MSERVTSLTGGKGIYHSQLNSNPSGNRQLLGQTNVGTLSDFLTVCLFSKGPVRDNLNKFVYSTTKTKKNWYINPGRYKYKSFIPYCTHLVSFPLRPP